jgi:hypothetical protein
MPHSFALSFSNQSKFAASKACVNALMWEHAKYFYLKETSQLLRTSSCALRKALDDVYTTSAYIHNTLTRENFVKIMQDPKEPLPIEAFLCLVFHLMDYLPYVLSPAAFTPPEFEKQLVCQAHSIICDAYLDELNKKQPPKRGRGRPRKKEIE